jgi:hypothetical protein
VASTGRIPRAIEEGIMILVLLVVLALLLVGALPRWSYSRNWGFLPSGGMGLVLLIVIVLLLSGNL